MVLLKACVPVSQTGSSSQTSNEYYADKVLRTEDHVYIEDVRTVKMYTESDKIQDVLNPAIQSIDQEFNMVLEFDLLRDQPFRAEVRIINCNADWSVSNLLPMQYLADFNQFYINNPIVSNSTRVPYWHYKFVVPRVKLPGNYLVVVTGPGGENDYILTRRFMVYSNQVAVTAEVRFGASPATRFSHQQVDFNVFYPEVPLVNPAQEVKVVVRQNYRWDNAKFNLRPVFVREDQRRLEYTYFQGENAFPGGNEFRAFDIRSLRSAGINVGRVDQSKPVFEVQLGVDKSWEKSVYSQEIDINGQFVIGNREFGDGDYTGDYANVQFMLQTPPVQGNVYVFGGLTDWKIDNRNLLSYDADKQAYVGSLFLKQGYYNYMYAIRPTPTSPVLDEVKFQGSHNITENIYEILVYYRGPGQRADQLVGYYWTNYFGRDLGR